MCVWVLIHTQTRKFIKTGKQIHASIYACIHKRYVHTQTVHNAFCYFI